MTTRQWKLIVTEIGTALPVAEAVVEAPNWMAGIKLARGRIGEPEAIPQGASCTVAPDGRVTVFDAVRRRSYVLTPLSDAGAHTHDVSYPPGVFTASQVPAMPPAQAPAYAPPPAPARRERPKTMAYILEGPLPVPGPAQVSVGIPAAPHFSAQPVPPPAAPVPEAAYQPPPAQPVSASRAAMRRTMAFVPGQFDLPPLPTREVVVGLASSVPPAPAVLFRPTAEAEAAPSITTAESNTPRPLFERSVEPNEESPLHYHLIGLFVPGNPSSVELERAMVAELDRIRKSIGAAPEGHLVQVLAYNEPVAEPAEGSEVAQLTWRGWRRESNVRFPRLEAEVSIQNIPGAERYPLAAGDPRLTEVLDAFEDVWFLATPAAGLEFCARLVRDVFDDVHVLMAGLAAEGPGFVTTTVHGDLPAYAVPPRFDHTGLVRLALSAAGRPVVMASPSADASIDAGSEGLATGPIAAMVAPHGGEALGYVRIARAKGEANFTAGDAEIMRAIVERLGLFLRLRGACIVSET